MTQVANATPSASAPAPPQFKIIEIRVDEHTTIRRLVPADTKDRDTPVGSRLLSAMETQGRLARQSDPDPIEIGDAVKLRANLEQTGTVDAQLKSGQFQVKWDKGGIDRIDSKDLLKVW